jgi:hypothetical protein
MDSVSEEYGVDQAAISSARSEPVVSVRGLVKRYGSHQAVAGIDLEVPQIGFPFVVYTIWRAIAQRRPFRCPECGTPIQADGLAAA